MKIDKKKPSHWLALLAFGLNSLAALILRKLIRLHPRTVLLFGHKFNGNLKALYEENIKNEENLDIFFLTMSSSYHKKLKKEGINTILATRPNVIKYLAKASVIVTDHGLHSASILLHDKKLKFADVWHGVPFKGFDEDDFKLQHRYDEIWVTSENIAELYTKKFGFSKEQVFATGYGRTDKLINMDIDTNKIKKQLSIPEKSNNVILYAPTWQQDDKDRTIYPFDTTEEAFYYSLNETAKTTNSTCIIRPHLNYKLDSNQSYSNLIIASAKDYPDTESILAISDILICDWSSIAFDYLVLNRPTIFLDTPPPFKKGLSLGTEHRFGKLVSNLHTLEEAIKEYSTVPNNYLEQQQKKIDHTFKFVYEGLADGLAAHRYLERIKDLTKHN